MNKFTQHIPTFVETMGEPPPFFEFETTEQLLANELVMRYATGAGFDRFVKSDHYLMTVSDGGFHWWVVGYIKDPSVVDLPEWDGGKHRVRMPDGDERIVTKNEFRSSCGDQITLRDGTVARNLRR